MALRRPETLGSGNHETTVARAVRKRSFSAGVPIVTRRQSSSRGHREQSRTSTPRSTSPCQTAWPPARCGRNSTKLAPLGNVVDGELGQRVDEPLALGDDLLDPGVHLVDVAQGQSPGRLLGGVEVVREHHLLQVAHEPRRRDDVSEAGGGHAPGLREGPHDGQRSVLADEIEGGPVGELGVRLVDDDQPGRLVEEHAHHHRVLDRAGRVVRRAEERHRRLRRGTTRRASSISSVKSAARSPEITVAPLTRAMWACNWYVGSKVTTVRPGPA